MKELPNAPGELADELALEVDDADVAVGDEKLDDAALVGSSEADVVEAAVVAERDCAALVDLVLAHAEVADWVAGGGSGFDTRAVGL